MLTSIIILTKNQLDYTKKCFESIRKYTAPNTYELIIVDNFSDDGTREWLQAQQDIKLILNDENKGFPKGCNQGIEIATGDTILLLNNDTVVTENWLNNLLTCLYSAEDIGAVGPVTNNAAYYSTIPAEYDNLIEMQNFAKSYNQSDASKWEQRVKLIGFCMLIKREVVDKIGLLDEQFTPGNYEDDDYSYRIQLAGYKLMICKDVFIHHYGNVSFNANKKINYNKNLELNKRKFERKWGFSSFYSSMIRTDILSVINAEPDEEFNVLEVGCATGATLIEIKNRFKNAKLSGIEINENSAAITQNFIDIKANNIEGDIEFPENHFDYILFGDVLEHLYNPWQVLDNMRRYLKTDGKVIISIPNVMHYSLLHELLHGGWQYEEAGLLDRTHIRFFTAKELDGMMKNAYYTNIEYRSLNYGSETPEADAFIQKLVDLTNKPALAEQYKTYQYLIVANKYPDEEVKVHKQIKEAVENVDFEEDMESNLKMLLQFEVQYEQQPKLVLESILKNSLNAVPLLQKLALKAHELKVDTSITLKYLFTAYDLNPKDQDTIYNLAFILIENGDADEAIKYMESVDEMDAELKELYHYVSK